LIKSELLASIVKPLKTKNVWEKNVKTYKLLKKGTNVLIPKNYVLFRKWLGIIVCLVSAGGVT